MPLPKQVQQQIAEAKRIEGEIRDAQTAPPSDESTPPNVSEAPIAAAEPVVAAPAPVEPVAPAPAPQPSVGDQYAELLHQYRTLQGIHRTLVRTNTELQSQVQTLQASVTSMTSEIEQLKQRPAQPSAPSAPLSAEEIEQYGEGLISVIERKARELTVPLNEQLSQANQELAKLKEHNTRLEQSLNGVNQQQAETRVNAFQQRLISLVPDINALNYDQGFLTWLAQADPLDARRRTLQQRLDEAVQIGDADAVANFFHTYRRLTTPQPVSPAPSSSSAQMAQAQPMSRSGPDADTSGQSGKRWTQKEIGDFYADVSKGKYSPAEKTRIERDIYAAQKDNRIAA